MPLPAFDGSSQSSANTWVKKLDVYFQLNPMVEEDALKMDILHLDGDSNEWWFHGLKIWVMIMLKHMDNLLTGY